MVAANDLSKGKASKQRGQITRITSKYREAIKNFKQTMCNGACLKSQQFGWLSRKIVNLKSAWAMKQKHVSKQNNKKVISIQKKG